MKKKQDGMTFFSGSERASITWITIPNELAEWAAQNQEFVARIQSSLSNIHADAVTEEQLWETIAEASSPEWTEAKESLNRANHRWADLNSPEKKPLGPIGHALDSDETNAAGEQLASSLADFTVINEGLRQRGDLNRLLGVLLVQKRLLEKSAERARDVKKATEAFAAVAGKQANKPSPISSALKVYAEKLLRQKKVKNEPVPS